MSEETQFEPTKRLGRPRKNEPMANEGERATVEKKDGEYLVKIGSKTVKFLQFTGKEYLPEAKYDKEGNCIEAGEPRFFVNMIDRDTYKIIRVWRENGRVKRVNWRTIRPRKKDLDRTLFIALKKAGITGLPKLFDRDY